MSGTPDGYRKVRAVRSFRGRNARDISPGQTEVLHDSAARAAVYRGDAVYVTKADSGAPEKGAPVPLAGPSWPLSGADGRSYDSESEVMNTARKKDLVKILDTLAPGHGLSEEAKKSTLKAATRNALNKHGL